MLSIIAAIDEKKGLGKNNQLLFKVPEDFQRFKSLTIGHPIIMGRKTYESIGRVLPNRTNIIITRDKNYNVAGALVVGSLEEALVKNSKYQVVSSKGENEIFIIGGGQIFAQAVPFVDRLYLTIVKGDYAADTFFPEYEDLFKKVLKKEKGKSGEYEYTFLDLER